jgi:ABC-type amino acid transport substrate-binding protein
MRKQNILIAGAIFIAVIALLIGINKKEETVSLDKLYVVNTGSLTGTFNAIQNAYTSDLEKHFDVELVQAKGCAKGKAILEKLEAPAFMIWEGYNLVGYKSGKNPECALDITSNNFVRADWKYNYIVASSSTGLGLDELKNSDRTFKLGYAIVGPFDLWVNELSNNVASTLQPVAYESSGAASLALINGEIDYLVVNGKQVAKFSAQGKMTKVATFNPEGDGDTPAIKSFADFTGADKGVVEFFIFANGSSLQKQELIDALNSIHQDQNANATKWYNSAMGFVNSLNFDPDTAFSRSMSIAESHLQ